MRFQKYYTIEVDGADGSARFLGFPRTKKGEEIDPRVFNRCVLYSMQGDELLIEVDQPGQYRKMELGGFDMLVVSDAIAKTIVQFVASEDIQLIPALIDKTVDRVWILNVLRSISCLDEERSVLESWNKPPEALEPGEHPFVCELAIRREPVAGFHIFRVAEWPMALVVSEDLRHAIVSTFRSKLLGVEFEQIEAT